MLNLKPYLYGKQLSKTSHLFTPRKTNRIYGFLQTIKCLASKIYHQLKSTIAITRNLLHYIHFTYRHQLQISFARDKLFYERMRQRKQFEKKKSRKPVFFFFAFNRIQPQTLNPNTCVIYQFCTEIILLKLNMIFRFLLQYIYASEFILDLYRHCSLIDQCAARCALIQVRGSPLDFRKVHSKFQHSQVNKMSTKLA